MIELNVFPKDTDGCPIMWDYQVKGFFKDTCGALKRVSEGKDLRSAARYGKGRARRGVAKRGMAKFSKGIAWQCVDEKKCHDRCEHCDMVSAIKVWEGIS